VKTYYTLLVEKIVYIDDKLPYLLEYQLLYMSSISVINAVTTQAVDDGPAGPGRSAEGRRSD
jgi:hypothetical protein